MICVANIMALSYVNEVAKILGTCLSIMQYSLLQTATSMVNTIVTLIPMKNVVVHTGNILYIKYGIKILKFSKYQTNIKEHYSRL